MLNKETESEISKKIAVEKLGLGVAPIKKKYPVTDKETRGRHLKDYLWKKGQSGNPKGRPINPLSLTALLNKKLSENPEDANAIVNALIALGKGRDMRAIEMSFERIDGKVVEVHKIEGELPIKLIFVPAAQLIENRKVEVVEGQAKELPPGE